MDDEKKSQYINIAAVAAVLAVLAVSAYYYLSTSKQLITTTIYPTTSFTLPLYGGNATAKAVEISPNSSYALNTSYFANSTGSYYQVLAVRYTTPLFYGPGASTAYDSMVGNPQFEILANNGLPIDDLAAKSSNNILEIWAYAEPFNTTDNALGMFNYMYQTHTGRGQSVPTQITPGIGSNSVLLTYNAITGELAPLNLYMVLFVYNSTFVQIGAWAPKNSTSNETISIARAYLHNLAKISK
ncbi:MAG: hypothetical protein KGH50_04085 [Candidatus Micrarchaeota archaeon]|nr:hypothetical protein [Candidatus Micrarchaeota archaeon]